MRILKYFILSALAFLSLNANNSCYDIYKTAKKPDMTIDRAIFVLIDEITRKHRFINGNYWLA